ncbi:YcxB family protein [Kordiimonas sp. SCSIO 12610]|uniref:YcxB family protein n=1 Tax=Kordiimonas sp. SCSIO 12610 TaxID=2829597 RepID=UPI00210A82AC|nr:YcxB family protein [Kordiimonas sp. SCSIO 12610]UTW56270.1 YcxB family protein [Kordiimonas sp. SCSIO 12610]
MATSQTYTLKYQKEFQHFQDLCGAARKKILRGSYRLISSAMPVIIMFALAIFIPLFFKESAPEIKSIIYISGTSILLYVFSIVFTSRNSMKKSLSADGLFMSPTTMVISEESIIETTQLSSSTYSWPAIKGFEEGRFSLLLMVDNSMALIIPKSALKDDAQISEIKNFIIEQIAKNKS